MSRGGHGPTEAIGLDLDRFAEDLRQGAHAARVREDVASAEASGAGGTPTFYVGGRQHSGAYDAETLARRLREAGPAAAQA